MNYIKTLILLLLITIGVHAQTTSTEVFGPDNTLLDFSGKVTFTLNGEKLEFTRTKCKNEPGNPVSYEVMYEVVADIKEGDVFAIEAEITGLEPGVGEYKYHSEAPNQIQAKVFVGDPTTTLEDNWRRGDEKKIYGVGSGPTKVRAEAKMDRQPQANHFLKGILYVYNHYQYYQERKKGVCKYAEIHFVVYPPSNTAAAERLGATLDSASDDSNGSTWVLIPAALLGLGIGGYVLVRVMKPGSKGPAQNLDELRAQQQQFEQQLAQEAALRAEEERERRIADELRRIQEEQHQWTRGQIQKLENQDTAFDRTLRREREERMKAHEKEMRMLEVKFRNNINVNATDDEVRSILSQRGDVAMKDREYYNTLADKYDSRLKVAETAKTAVDVVMDITSGVGQGGVKTVADSYKIARNYASHLGAYKAEGSNRKDGSFAKHMVQASLDSLIEYGQGQVKGVGYKYRANCAGDMLKAYANGLIEGKEKKEIQKDVKKAFTKAVGNTSIEALTGGIFDKLNKAARHAEVTRHMLRKKDLEGMRQFMGLSNKVTDALQNDSAARMASQMSRYDTIKNYGENVTNTLGQLWFGNYMDK